MVIENWKMFVKCKHKDVYVSDFGRVKSIHRKTNIENIIKLYNRGGKRNQYLCFGYRKEDGRKKMSSVHRAVAELYVENILGLEHVDHIDNNPENNYANNLQWLSAEENGSKRDK